LGKPIVAIEREWRRYVCVEKRMAAQLLGDQGVAWIIPGDTPK
jgi:hypothetical protein